MDDRSDEILVVASKRGQKDAYAALVRRHYKQVFAVCLGILGNANDAEDIAQDTMLTGYLKIRNLHKNDRFSYWIMQIARNLCIDLIRRKRHVKAILADRHIQTEKQNAYSHDLESGIKMLPLELRMPLVMYYFDNKSTENIARRFKMSKSDVCAKIREAKSQLYKFLTGRDKI